MEDLEDSPPLGEHRLRLRPWLEGMLDKGEVRGLQWLDEKRCYFRIPWKHRSKKDWDMEHIKVFMEWAKHTGKFHDGEQPDYVAMKTRLRCAFNKAPDIEEVKNLHRLKCADPYKVYLFLPKSDLFKEEMSPAGPNSNISTNRVCTVTPMVQPSSKHNDDSSDSDYSTSDDEQDDDPKSELEQLPNLLKNSQAHKQRVQRKNEKNAQDDKPSDGTVSCERIVMTSTPQDMSSSVAAAARMLLALNKRGAISPPSVNTTSTSGVSTTSMGLIPQLLQAPRRLPMTVGKLLDKQDMLEHHSIASGITLPGPVPLNVITQPRLITEQISALSPDNVDKKVGYLNENMLLRNKFVLTAEQSPDSTQASIQAVSEALTAKQSVIQEVPKVIWKNQYRDEHIQKMTNDANKTETPASTQVSQQTTGLISLQNIVRSNHISKIPEVIFDDNTMVAAEESQTVNQLLQSRDVSTPKVLPSPDVLSAAMRGLMPPEQQADASNQCVPMTGLNIMQAMQGPVFVVPREGYAPIPEHGTFRMPIKVRNVTLPVPMIPTVSEFHRGRSRRRGSGRSADGTSIRSINQGVSMSRRGRGRPRGRRSASGRQQDIAKVTFSNHGNIMATGVDTANSIVISNNDDNLSVANVLAEETRRMREAYATTAVVNNAGGPQRSSPVSDGDEPPKLLPISPDTIALYRQAQKFKSLPVVTAGIEESNHGSQETQQEGHVLDLRMSSADAVHSRDDAQVLDLRLARDDEDQYKSAPACLTREGALDLTLKRKPDDTDGTRGSQKKQATSPKLRNSLAVHAIWDLSTSKEEQGVQKPQPADGTPEDSTVVDLSHSTGGSTETSEKTDEKIGQNFEDVSDTEDGEDSEEEFLKPAPPPEISPTGKEPVVVAPTIQEDELDTRAAHQLIQLSLAGKKKAVHIPREDIIHPTSTKKDTPKFKASYCRDHRVAQVAPFSSSTKMSDNSRQRLRPWLESQINGGKIKGLQWIDKEQSLFRIPWKHGGKHDWTQDDSRIFMEWARHTGRYREGIDEEDYATWKTRLRCAFNKAPDIKEIKEKTNLSCSEPYRVYRLIPKKDLQRALSPYSHSDDEEDGHLNKAQVLGVPPVPSVVQDLMGAAESIPAMKWNSSASTSSYPSDLKSIKTGELILRYPTGAGAEVDQMDTAQDMLMQNEDSIIPSLELPSVTTMDQICAAISGGIDVMSDMPELVEEQEVTLVSSEEETYLPDVQDELQHSFRVLLKYQGEVVSETLVSRLEGCRVASQPQSTEANGESEKTEVLFPLKSASATMSFADQKICALLAYVKRGILFRTENADILATRMCQCGVLYMSQVGTDRKPQKLVRHTDDVKIFDFKQDFLNALHRYMNGQGPRPSPEVHLTFGQTCDLDSLDQSILISMTVVSCMAESLLNEHEEQQEMDTRETETVLPPEEFHISIPEDVDVQRMLQPVSSSCSSILSQGTIVDALPRYPVLSQQPTTSA